MTHLSASNGSTPTSNQSSEYEIDLDYMEDDDDSIEEDDTDDEDDKLFVDPIDYEEMTDKAITTEDDSDFELSKDTDETIRSEEYETEEDEEDEEDLYDSDDEEYSELVEQYMSDNTEDGNLHYFHNLSPKQKKQYIEQIKDIYSIGSSNTTVG